MFRVLRNNIANSSMRNGIKITHNHMSCRNINKQNFDNLRSQKYWNLLKLNNYSRPNRFGIYVANNRSLCIIEVILDRENP